MELISEKGAQIGIRVSELGGESQSLTHIPDEGDECSGSFHERNCKLSSSPDTGKN